VDLLHDLSAEEVAATAPLVQDGGVVEEQLDQEQLLGIAGDIKPVERNRFAVEGVGPDRLAVRGPESPPSS
jgi:hypothetical protein